MLMVVVGQVLSREHWTRIFAENRFEKEDCAGYVLEKFSPKLLTMNVDSPCELVLISMVNLAINNLIISYVREKTKKEKRVLQENDTFYHRPGNDRHSPAISGLEQHLLSQIPDICEGDQWMEQAYRFCVDSVLSGRFVPRKAQLPRGVGRILGEDGFAIIVYKLNRAINEYAADLN